MNKIPSLQQILFTNVISLIILLVWDFQRWDYLYLAIYFWILLSQALISYSPFPTFPCPIWSTFIVYISTQTTKVPIWSWSPTTWHLDFKLASIRKMALKRQSEGCLTGNYGILDLSESLENRRFLKLCANLERTYSEQESQRIQKIYIKFLWFFWRKIVLKSVL